MFNVIFFVLLILIFSFIMLKKKIIQHFTNKNIFNNKLYNSIVLITSNIQQINWAEPYTKINIGKGSGSGFFIDDKHIVTNFHVIENSTLISIKINNKNFKYYGDIISIYPLMDLALIKIRNHVSENYLTFGDSDKLIKLDNTFAIGYPLGLDQIKITEGIFSGFQDGKIQTTAPINPGNSGGPLLNDEGKVIGINFAGYVNSDNMGLAIPINYFKKVMNNMKKGIKIINYPIYGASFVPTNDLYLKNKLKENNIDINLCPSGITIEKIIKNSYLHKDLKLNEGDIICSIDKINILNNGKLKLNNYLIQINDYLLKKTENDSININYLKFNDKKPKIYTEKKLKLSNDSLFKIRYQYSNFNKIDYQIIGGLIIMELTLNHIISYFQNSNLTDVSDIENLTKKKLIITKKLNDSNIIDNQDILILPTLLTKINNVEVNTLDDLRKNIKISNENVPLKDSYIILNNTKFLLIETSHKQKFLEKHSVIQNNNNYIKNSLNIKLQP